MKKAVTTFLLLTAFSYLYIAKCKDMTNVENEIWKDVVGYENSYQVSSLGRIKSLDRLGNGRYGNKRKFKGRILNLEVNHRGYLRCTFSIAQDKTYHFVHRIVAEAFIYKRPENKEINHINGIKSDNRPENLQWATKSENGLHAYRTGLHPKRFGAKNHLTKLTEDQAIKIKEHIKEGVLTVRQIAKLFSVTPGAIYGIKRGENWAHIC